MASTPSTVAPESARINIQSKGHEKLLNIIDELRSQGISRFIDLPQLIVCGDQSSGKSSVLEAVSGLRFPTKDALCTRFATELVLRRNPETNSTVTIVPDPSRPEVEQKRLQAFRSDYSALDDLGSIVEEAGQAMGLQDSSMVFSTDVLRIELTGPHQPHLTLVDLPGLFHAGSKSQSDADADAVKALVTRYMKKSRSIILAVVSAKNDYNNQIVTKYARDFDPEGERTLGIITKPDTLPVGSDSEKQYVELAQNKDVFFRLGWHVLRNRTYEERNCLSQERDDNEEAFFSHGIWTSLSPANLGITTLRPRLSRVLQGQILTELPGLIRDVESGIKECNERLARLGHSRGTLLEQKIHLHGVSEAFTTLVTEAVNGTYNNEYFGSPASDDGYAKRTRAIVRNILDKFAEDVRLRGHQYEVVDKRPATESQNPPFKITEKERLDKIKKLIVRNRGRELASSSKEETITTLFHEQCSPWVDLAGKYADLIFTHVRSSVMLALEASCDPSTRDGVLSVIINKSLDQIRTALTSSVKRILKQHVSGAPTTINHYFTENIQKLRAQHDQEQLRKSLMHYFGLDPASENHITEMVEVNVRSLHSALTASKEANMTLFACSEALHVMQAYYKVAMKNFTDDFAIYAVEHEVMEAVPKIFCPRTVLGLPDDTTEEIAGETDESKTERASSSAKLAVLKMALDALRQLDRGKPQKMSTPLPIQMDGGNNESGGSEEGDDNMEYEDGEDEGSEGGYEYDSD